MFNGFKTLYCIILDNIYTNVYSVFTNTDFDFKVVINLFCIILTSFDSVFGRHVICPILPVFLPLPGAISKGLYSDSSDALKLNAI